MPTLARYFGFNPPFLGGPQNVMSRQTDEQLIKNDLLQLILTIPGERYGRPSFGTILRGSVFEQLDLTVCDEIQQNLIEVISREETRVSINEITVTPDFDRQSVTVLVNVSPNDQPLTEYLVEVQQKILVQTDASNQPATNSLIGI
jgi:phage baseplate assembly protein W